MAKRSRGWFCPLASALMSDLSTRAPSSSFSRGARLAAASTTQLAINSSSLILLRHALFLVWRRGPARGAAADSQKRKQQRESAKRWFASMRAAKLWWCRDKCSSAFNRLFIRSCLFCLTNLILKSALVCLRRLCLTEIAPDGCSIRESALELQSSSSTT